MKRDCEKFRAALLGCDKPGEDALAHFRQCPECRELMSLWKAVADCRLDDTLPNPITDRYIRRHAELAIGGRLSILRAWRQWAATGAIAATLLLSLLAGGLIMQYTNSGAGSGENVWIAEPVLGEKPLLSWEDSSFEEDMSRIGLQMQLCGIMISGHSPEAVILDDEITIPQVDEEL